ncbi:MAG: glycosyltransferase family 4 protein [Lachnospiraceae bacterium]
MDILYLTMSKPDLKAPGIYSDLINELLERGHKVTIALVTGRKNLKRSDVVSYQGTKLIRVRVGELFQVNFLVKGINTLKIEPCMRYAIRKFIRNAHYDLVIYATPPVTFASVIKYCKKQFGCKTFLMLKDIFPQNAVDIGLFKENGLLHRLFKKKEERLYSLSDMIGCMSQGNLRYMRKHHAEIDESRLILFPNTMKVLPFENEAEKTLEPSEEHLAGGEKNMREKKVRFVFGGNLGKPQALDFLIQAVNSPRMRACKQAEFLFVGEGSEQEKVKKAFQDSPNARFISFLPPREYDRLMADCDVGMISLDIRFTIPNYPSRILGYMAAAKPMLACTDRSTDVKELLTEEADCGLWCASDDLDAFCENVERLCADEALRRRLGSNGRRYLKEHFDVCRSAELIESWGSRSCGND